MTPEEWLKAQGEVWHPRVDQKPRSASEAARRFRCPKVSATISGADCAESYRRSIRAHDQNSGRSATCCTDCVPGRVRSELLSITNSAADRIREAARRGERPSAKRRKPHRPQLAPRPPKLTIPRDLLGTMPDGEIAVIVGCSTNTIARRRKILGVPPFRPAKKPTNTKKARPKKASNGTTGNAVKPTRPSDHINWSDVGLGEKPDTVIAMELGVDDSVVRRRRKKLGIRKFLKSDVDWSTARLGLTSDRSIARDLNVPLKAVRSAREERGIPPFVTCNRRTAIDWSKVQFGSASDADLARELGCSDTSVWRQRRRRGIPPYEEM